MEALGKKCENGTPGTVVLINILCPYHNGMNGMDIADQLCGSYHIDKWMCKQK